MPTHEGDYCPYGCYSPESTCNCVFCERNRLKAENALYFSEMVDRGDRIDELETLVREMAGLLTYRSDGAAHEILNRPEVKAIME